jgi:septum formation inhibitor MinC
VQVGAYLSRFLPCIRATHSSQAKALIRDTDFEVNMENLNSQTENKAQEKAVTRYEDIPEIILKEKKDREAKAIKKAEDDLLKKISKEEYKEILEKEKKTEFAPEERTQEELDNEDKRVMKILENIRKEEQ